MKKILLALILSIASVSTFAQHHGHYHNQNGLNAGEAIVLGIIGAGIYGAINQPRVIVQPPVVVYPQYPVDQCSNAQYYDGVYNPPLAQSFCRGQVAAELQRRRAWEQEAYRRGYGQ